MAPTSRNPLSKALGILRWLLDSGVDSFGVREVAAALNMTPSAAHRAISALVEEGILRRMPDSSRYGLGLELFRLVNQAADKFPIRQLAMPPMERLRDLCGEAVFLNLYDPDRQEIIGVAAAESKQPLRYVVVLQEWKSLHSGASGQAVLAFLPPADREAVYAKTGLRAETAATITDRAQMEAQLEQIRTDGYALTKGQRITGAIGMAAPIRGAGGGLIGSLGISIPEPRYQESFAETYAAQLCATAAEISLIAGAPRQEPS
ncbi:IclR family transcriptional regulator [Marivita sp. S6314]|uniref:IclR family transcriptional regulator n=1 Tax=Marivita sp. S6314 TaxID=2926406 RepID=UPI001FF32F0B|nr:IclR family transcriptional regulator [Marivita sp. S6314]MCK0150882.1 IclR family transcriptional regulator [Marivita sp. S6314]